MVRAGLVAGSTRFKSIATVVLAGIAVVLNKGICVAPALAADIVNVAAADEELLTTMFVTTAVAEVDDTV